MNDQKQNVVIVPCSGIGKSFGSVSREAAYELCEALRPNDTRLVALSKLVLGDEEAREMVARNPAVTIDGCKHMCAAKMVKQSGGTIAREATVFDAFRQRKDLKPEGIAELNEAGVKLGSAMAEDIAETVDQIARADVVKGERHA